MENDKLNKTPRASQSRVSDKRPTTWTPPSSLDAPPAPDGFVHRWIRTASMGFQDTANVSKKMREGWEFVRAEEIKNQLRAYLPKTRGPLKYGSTQKRLDVVVTTYSYFSSEKSDDRSFLRKFEWDYVSIYLFFRCHKPQQTN